MVRLRDGGFGCVNDPPLKCLEHKPNSFYKKKISKLMSKHHAVKEIEEQYKIDIIDKTYKYHVPPPVMCNMNNSAENKQEFRTCGPLTKHKINEKDVALLIFKSGGRDLDIFAKNMALEHGIGSIPIAEKKQIMTNFWIESVKLIEFLKLLNKNKLMHNDLKHTNVVYNIETNEIKVIDFGLVMDMNDYHKQLYHMSGHFSYPPDIYFLKDKNVFENEFVKMSNTEFSEFILRNMYLFDGYDTFLARVVVKNNPREHFANYGINTDKQYKDELRVNYYHGVDYKVVLNKTILTHDIYGMGLALMSVFVKTFKYIDDNDPFIVEMNKLLFSMIHPNTMKRIEIDELLVKYKVVVKMLLHPDVVSTDFIVQSRVTKNNKTVNCKPDEEIHPDTGKCRKKCKDNQERNPLTGRCKTVKKDTENKNNKTVNCKPDEEIHPDTGKCRKKCKDNQERNPLTGRCKNITETDLKEKINETTKSIIQKLNYYDNNIVNENKMGYDDETERNDIIVKINECRKEFNDIIIMNKQPKKITMKSLNEYFNKLILVRVKLHKLFFEDSPDTI
jgi:hypothetical protein